MSLIHIQNVAIKRLHESRNSDKRHWKWEVATRRWYQREAIKLGLTADQANVIWRDVRDVYELERDAE